MMLLGLILSQLEAGQDMAKLGGMLIVASQVLHPFWRPKWKPEPPPPRPTLGDFGISLKKGERYVAGDAAAVDLVVWWKPMGSSNYPAVLPKGTLVIVDHDHEADVHDVFVSAADHAAMEPVLVPELHLKSSTYNGYSLMVSPEVFAKQFTRF